MPDTVVPVVRRPVRRVSATPDPKELSSGDPPNWNGELAVEYDLRDAPLSKKCSFFEHCSKGL